MTSQDERFQNDSSLGQKWGKLADCPIYTPLERKHGDFYWHPFGKSGFGKCYLNGEAHLLLCLRSRNGQEFLALIQRAKWNPVAGLNSNADPGTQPELPYLSQLLVADLTALETRLHGVLGANGQEQAMFVDVVEGVENVKTRVPSLVWAETAENFNNLLTHAIYHSQTGHFPVMGIEANWELRLGRDAALTDQATGDVIQRTAEIVQDVTDNQGNLSGDNRDVLDVVRQIAGFRILLGCDSAWVGLTEFRQSGFELSDVLLGPLTLRKSFTID
jgi:hypothetical protein